MINNHHQPLDLDFQTLPGLREHMERKALSSLVLDVSPGEHCRGMAFKNPEMTGLQVS